MMNLIVLGGGESGVGAALLGKKIGYKVFLSDKSTLSDAYRNILIENDLEFEEGGHTEERVFAANLVVKSPGIPDTVPMIVKLRSQGIEVISEIEFAGRNSSAKQICITGSNGKTTTTLFIHHILTTAGIDAGLAGNIGKSLAAQVAENAHSLYVVELSSFQLDTMYQFKADIAVMMNITPDHLDRYDYKFENYVDSKFRILNNMCAEDLFIYCEDSEAVARKCSEIKIIPETSGFSYKEQAVESGAWMEGEMLVVRMNSKEFRINKAEISLKGRHNVYNAMAAILVCMRMGIDHVTIADGLCNFPQVEHRLETVMVKDGVTYINDSKATNVDSAWYALDSMTRPVVWIAGGTDKGNDYSVLFDLVREKLKVLICMGVDNQKLIEAFGSICEVVSTNSLADAINAAESYAESGDTVLLSPCCASFDLFKNYEDRGKQFKAVVRELK